LAFGEDTSDEVRNIVNGVHVGLKVGEGERLKTFPLLDGELPSMNLCCAKSPYWDQYVSQTWDCPI